MIHRFGEVELDVEAHELRRAGVPVAIQPKVFGVLQFLAEHPDRVVDKDELLDAVWPTELVNEAAVAWCVSHARRAIGQRKGDRGPIETVHGRGYRFRATPARTPQPRALTPQSDGPGPELPGGEHPLVGRAAVLARLESALERLRRGQGGLVALRGDAGIGKTRCAEALLAAACREGLAVAVGRCPEDEAAPPLWPFVQLLRAFATGPEPALARAAAELLPSLEPGPRSEPGADEFWLLDRLAAALTVVGAPRVMVLDDVQWADRASLRVLALLAPELASSPLLVAITLREPLPRGASGRTAELQRVLRHADSVPLSEFGLEDVRECVRRASGREPDPLLLAGILRRTAGNPLLVHEAMELLAARHGPEWPVVAAADELVLQEVGRGLIRSRLTGLGADALSVLSVASIIGDTFSLSVLEGAAALAPERLLAALDAAVDAHALRELPGVGEYTFGHALLRDVVADELPRAARAPLHAAVAEALSRTPGAPVGEIALHYQRALPLGDRDRAVHYARAAGRAALDLFSYDEAARYFDWAIEATRYGNAVPPERVAELHLDAARALRLAHRGEDSRRHLEAAIDLGKRHGLGALLVRAGRRLRSSYAWRTAPDPLARTALEEALRLLGPGEPALRVRALSELAGIPPYALRRSASRPLADEALSLAGPLGWRARLDALRARMFSSTGPDDIDGLLATVDEILALEAAQGPTWMSLDALYAEIGARLLSGDLARAEVALGRFGAIAGELRLAEATWQHDRVRAQIAFARADFATAERSWLDLAARGERIGLDYARLLLPTHLGVLAMDRDGRSIVDTAGDALDRLWEWMKREPRHRATMARVLLEGGRREAAAAELVSLVDDTLPGLEPDYHHLWILANLALVAVGVGDRARGLVVERALEPFPARSAVNSFQFTLGATDHALGLLAELRGDLSSAATRLQRAVAENRCMGLPVPLARSELELARVLGRTGDAEGALRHLSAGEALARQFALPALLARAAAIRSGGAAPPLAG